MKFLLCLLPVLLCGIVRAEPIKQWSVPIYEWKENVPAADDDIRGEFCGHTKLSAEFPVVEVGTPIFFDVRFTNESQLFSNEFFNVNFLNRGGVMSAAIAIFDEKHEYIGDLLQFTSGHRRKNNLGDWTLVPAMTYVGTSISGVLSFIFPHLRGMSPGVYYAQVIYNRSLIAPKPKNDQELAEFSAHPDKRELFRSNVVRIEVIPPKQTK